MVGFEYSGASIEKTRRERAAKRWARDFSHGGIHTLTAGDIDDLSDYLAHELKALRVDLLDIESGFKLYRDFIFPEQMAQKVKIELVKKISIFNFTYYKKRLCCKRWWKSQLWRWVVQGYEAWAIGFGKVGAAAGAWYCTDRTLCWRSDQIEKAQAMMKARVIESEAGERVTLWDAARSTVANKSHRRDELMTRIKGCEAWANDQGMACLFTTNTCPSRYHAQKKGGGKNPKYDGSTPRQAQAWLNATWARCRAQWKREGVGVMGFRVVEPHHDGCPHWHMLLWCKESDIEKVSSAMRSHWLREPEFGSDKNRLKIVTIDRAKGSAVGYIAKYIAKNIDDHTITHHQDTDFDEYGTNRAIVKEDNPARRVDAWASCWRIRQFQAIGQPPVTVWRELRRTTREAAAGGSDALICAWLAVHRQGERLACWHSYMKAQGGAMCKRKAYKLGSYSIEKQTRGLYGEAVQDWVCGVADRSSLQGFVTPTKRQQWGGEGFSQGRNAPAWTRLNNCTLARASNRQTITKTLDDWQATKQIDSDFQIDDAMAKQADDFWAAQTTF